VSFDKTKVGKTESTGEGERERERALEIE